MIQIYKPTNENYEQNGDSVLTPSSAKVTAELNGAWSATIEHPIDEAGRWKYIVDEAVVKMPSFNGEQLFRIKQKEKSDSGISASLEPIFWDCIGDCILINKRPAYANGQRALDIMISANPKYSGKSNITKLSYGDYHLINLMEAISGERKDSFLNHWDGEVIYDNFTVVINERAGADNGVELRYGKNIPIDGMREETDFESIITRIYPLAFGGMRSLGDNNGYVDSPIADKYPAIKATVMTFDDVKMREDLADNEDVKDITVCDTQAELDAALRARCEAQFAAGIDRPKVTISADMVLLKNTEEYKDYQVLEEVSLGDTIHCINNHLGIVTDARIISLTYDSISKKVEKVVIGGYQYDYFNALTSGTWKANNTAALAAKDAVVANQSAADIKKELEGKFPVSIADGGTGKTTADEARENLGVAPKVHNHDDRYYTETEINSKLAEKAAKNHTHSEATASSAGFMSSSDKKKLDTVAEGANKTVVDSALNNTSANPVQNKVLKSELDKKAPKDHKHDAGDITSGLLPVVRGGTGAGDRKAAAANLLVLPRNTVPAEDTPKAWAELGNCIIFFDENATVINKPTNYGTLIQTLSTGTVTSVEQVWQRQAYGHLFYRAGNTTGWYANADLNGADAWHAVLDDRGGTIKSTGYGQIALNRIAEGKSPGIRFLSDGTLIGSITMKPGDNCVYRYMPNEIDSHKLWDSSAPIPISGGGTGANAAAKALKNLQGVSKNGDIMKGMLSMPYGYGYGMTASTGGMGILDGVGGGWHVRTSTASGVGILKVVLPQDFNGAMIKFDVEVHSYSYPTVCTYTVGGRIYKNSSTGGYSWAGRVYDVNGNTTTTAIDLTNLTIRFGRHKGKAAISIGDADTTWGVANFVIKNFKAFYTGYNVTNWNEGWEVILDTNPLDEVLNTYTNPHTAVEKHTHEDMKGATTSAAGEAGFVPAPAAGAQGKFLRGDGTWEALSAADIISGILPITRGGTGAATPDEARENLGIKGYITEQNDDSGYIWHYMRTDIGLVVAWASTSIVVPTPTLINQTYRSVVQIINTRLQNVFKRIYGGICGFGNSDLIAHVIQNGSSPNIPEIWILSNRNFAKFTATMPIVLFGL